MFFFSVTPLRKVWPQVRENGERRKRNAAARCIKILGRGGFFLRRFRSRTAIEPGDRLSQRLIQQDA